MAEAPSSSSGHNQEVPVPPWSLIPIQASTRRVSFREHISRYPEFQEAIATMEIDSDISDVSIVTVSPPFSISMSSEDLAREERLMFETACREFLQRGVQNGIVDPRIAESPIITPYSWVKFRQQIERDGTLRIGNNQIITKISGILFKRSNMKPICTHPSCFSTDIGLRSRNRRCFKHAGDRTSFKVLEILFKEIALGRTLAVGIEHINLMFAHYDNDTELELRDRILEEYFRSGLVRSTFGGLQRIKFKKSAEELLSSDSITVRRHWTFDNAEEASNHYYKVAVAAELVAKKLKSYHVIPNGEFKGLHMEAVRIPNTVGLEGEAYKNLDKRFELSKQINKEQHRQYGIKANDFVFEGVY